jgi:quinol monooxygenase YgiN
MSDAMVRMRVEWVVPSGQACRVASAVQSLMVLTRRQHGCVGCSLTSVAGDYVRLCYDECWEDEDCLRRQVMSERFTALAGLLEQGASPPTIEFTLPGCVRGLDYAEELREAPRPARRRTAG